MSHGTLPTMVVIRHEKRLIINVTDYDPETDSIPGVVVETSDDTVVVPPDPERVAIPDGWESLSWPAMRSLASKVSPTPIQGRNDAVAAIKAYLEA